MAIQGGRFLVTGGAGFIGSHLVERLLKNGAAQVIVLDNLHCGSRDNLIPGCHQFGERLKLVSMDLALAGEEELHTLLTETDFLYHLAAEKHNQSKDTPEHVMQVNVLGTHRLFQAAVTAGIKKVIFTSSLYAYGTMSHPPMTETQLPVPQTIYGISKLAGEHLLKHFQIQHGLQATVLRLFFVYGPRQYAGRGYKSVILSNFERLLKGEAPVIFGDGEQALDYTYVDDVVSALLASLRVEANGETINIGSGTATSIRELTTLMCRMACDEVEPRFGPTDWTHDTYRVSDNSKALHILNWKPSVSLEQGLNRVYRWLLAEQAATSDMTVQWNRTHKSVDIARGE